MASLILLATLLRIAYLALACPYGLIEDEAYYWMWSHRLDLSYLTKGPGVALTIALGTAIAGDTELGVRLTAPLWGGVLALGIAGLAGELVRTSGERAVASARLWGAAAALLSPPMQAAALLMTIDGPMLACWAMALWMGARALGGGGGLASWAAAGLWIGLGVLFKPTIAIVAPVIVLLAVTQRGSLGRWWIGSGLVLALTAAGFLPQVIWNAQHDWAMASHLGEHLAGDGGAAALQRVGWIAEFIGVQALLAGPALLAVLPARKGKLFHRPAVALSLATAGAVYGLYLIVAAFTRVEGNWPLGGLLPVLAIAAAWLASPGAANAPAVDRPNRAKLRQHAARAIVIIGLVTGLGMLRLDWIGRIPGLGGQIPLGRLMNGPALAAGVRERAQELQGQHAEPLLVITDHYGRAAQLEFYLRQPAGPDTTPPSTEHVLCASGALGGRITQFDLWPDFDLRRPDLLDRSALLLGSRPEVWHALFAEVDEIEPIRGDHKARRAFLGAAYRGIAAEAAGDGESSSQ